MTDPTPLDLDATLAGGKISPHALLPAVVAELRFALRSHAPILPNGLFASVVRPAETQQVAAVVAGQIGDLTW